MTRNLFLASTVALVLTTGATRGDESDAAQLAGQAEQYARDKKYDKAIEAIRKAIALEPRNDRYLMVASEIERRAGRFADGVKDALAAIKINDKVSLYYALVAANAYGDQEPEMALEYCRKVIEMGESQAGAGVYRDVKTYEDLLVKKTCTITWNLDPSDPKRRKFVRDSLPIALPKGDLPYQQVTVQVKGAKRHQIIKGDANDVVRVVPDGDKPFQVITKVTVQPISYKAKLAKASGTLPPGARAFLGASEGFDPESPTLKKIAAEVKGKDGVATVKNVLSWLQKNVKYKDETSNITKLDFKTVDEIVERGHAECRGYTMLFAALCRSAGVPARPVWGILFYPKGFASHNWDEVYIAGVGWVPVDPQKPETFGWLPIDHVRVFMDLRKSATSEENLPLLNLLFMNGEKLQYEQTR
jgi:transglutaminase-like putative cysteine protease